MTYFLYKKGIYGHGVFWIGNDLEEGKRKADEAATQDMDDYHDWELYEFTEQSAFKYDAEHVMVYRGIRKAA